MKKIFFCFFTLCMLSLIGILQAQQTVNDTTYFTNRHKIYLEEDHLPVSYTAFQELLGGQITGLQVQALNGDYSSAYRMYSRGVSGLYEENHSPLIVIDGVPFYSIDERYGNIFTFLHPSDIESIQLLKNADEIAMYGIYASQGVLLIKTKQANVKQKLNIRFHHAFSFAENTNRVDVINAKENRELIREYFPNYLSKLGESDTDWQEEVSQLAKRNHHYLNVNGKVGNTSYYLRGNIDKGDGVVKYSDYNNKSFSTKLEQAFFQNKLFLSASYSKAKLDQTPYNQEAFHRSIACNPTLSTTYNPDPDLFTITPYNYFKAYDLKRSIDNENFRLSMNFTVPFIPGMQISALYHKNEKELEDTKFYNGELNYSKKSKTVNFCDSELDYLYVGGIYATDISEDIKMKTSLSFERFFGKDVYNEKCMEGDINSILDIYSDYTFANKYDFSALSTQVKLNFYKKIDILLNHKIERGKGGDNKIASSSLGVSYLLYQKREGILNDLFLRGSYGLNGKKLKGEFNSERYHTTNFAIDINAFNKYLNLSLETYHQKFKNYGYFMNDHVIQGINYYYIEPVNWSNKGIELSLRAKVMQTKNTKWKIRANLAYNKNKVSLPDQLSEVKLSDYNPVYIVDGESLRQFHLYKQEYDQNGNPIALNSYSDERIFSHKYSYIPSYIYGIHSQFNYKKWDFSLRMRGNIGNYIFNEIERRYGNREALKTENSTTSYYQSELVRSNGYSDYYLKNASFLRMESIRLGYYFQKIRKSKIDAYCYVSAQNLFTITGYDGLNVDSPNGTDSGTLPVPRIISFGVNFSLN